MATNFMVGHNTASAIAFRVAEVILLPFRIRSHIPGRHQPRIVAVRLELPAQVMRPNARLHADEAGRRIREPSLDLAARKLLAQNDRAIPVETDEMERVLADVDADCCNGFKATGVVAWNAPDSVAPNQLCGWLGQEHGGSIPLADIERRDGHVRLVPIAT
jgi:hypothetical protein